MDSVKKKGIVIGKVTDGNITVISGNRSSFFSKLNGLLLLLLVFSSFGVNFVESFGMKEDDLEKIQNEDKKDNEEISTSTKVHGGDVSACDSQDIGLGKAYNDVSKSCKEVLEACRGIKEKVVHTKNEIQRRQNNILNTGHEGYYYGVNKVVCKDNEVKIESGGKYFDKGFAVEPKYAENSNMPSNEAGEVNAEAVGGDGAILKYVLDKGVNHSSRDIMCDRLNEELFDRSYAIGFQKRDLDKDIEDDLGGGDDFKRLIENIKQHETEFNGQYNKTDGTAYGEVLGSMKAAFGVEEEKKEVEKIASDSHSFPSSEVKSELNIGQEKINKKKEKEKEEEKVDYGLLENEGVDRLSGLQQSMDDIICLESMTERIEDTIKIKNNFDKVICRLNKIRAWNQDDKGSGAQAKPEPEEGEKGEENIKKEEKEKVIERNDLVDVGTNEAMGAYLEEHKKKVRDGNLDYDKRVLLDVPGGYDNDLFSNKLITIGEEDGKVSLEGLEEELKRFEQEAEDLKGEEKEQKEKEKGVNDSISKLQEDIEKITAEKKLNKDDSSFEDQKKTLNENLKELLSQKSAAEKSLQEIELKKGKLMKNVDDLCGLVVGYTENNVTKLLYVQASCFIRRYDFSIKRNNNANVNMFCVKSFGPLYNLLLPLVKNVEAHRESKLPRFLFKRTLFFTLGSIISGIGGEVNNWKPLYRGNWFSLNMYRSRIFTSYGVNLQINNLPVINTLTVHVIGIHFIPLLLGCVTCLLTSGFVNVAIDKNLTGIDLSRIQRQKKKELNKEEVLGTNIFGTIRDLCYSFKHAIGKLSIGGFKECMFHCIGSYMRGVDGNMALCDIGYLLTRRLLFDSIQICSISIPVHEYVSININLGSVLLQGIVYLIYRLTLPTPRHSDISDKLYTFLDNSIKEFNLEEKDKEKIKNENFIPVNKNDDDLEKITKINE